jgi:hypothetical protein
MKTNLKLRCKSAACLGGIFTLLGTLLWSVSLLPIPYVGLITAAMIFGSPLTYLGIFAVEHHLIFQSAYSVALVGIAPYPVCGALIGGCWPIVASSGLVVMRTVLLRFIGAAGCLCLAGITAALWAAAHDS